MPDHPNENHYLNEDGTYLLNEDGTFFLNEFQEDEMSRFRQEGEPYSFFLLEDGSGDLLLEEQPTTNVGIS